MSQADAEDGQLALGEHSKIARRIRHGGGIARSVRDEDAIRSSLDDLLGGRGGRHDGDSAPMRVEEPQDVALDAEVVRHELARRRGTPRARHLTGDPRPAHG